MILSDFRAPGAHFESLGAHFEDISDLCDFGDVPGAKAPPPFEVICDHEPTFYSVVFRCFS